MPPKRDNYAIQAESARLRFLTYDQTAMPVEKDDDFLFLPFCGCDYRISRANGHLFRRAEETWIPADSHGEVLTIFDYLCDVTPGRAPSGEFVSLPSLGGYIHGGLTIHSGALECSIDGDPARFRRVCLALGCTEGTGGDICFDMNLFPDLPLRLQFWHSDEEFPPKLDVFWDRNALLFLHYETLWYAAGVLRSRLQSAMEL